LAECNTADDQSVNSEKYIIELIGILLTIVSGSVLRTYEGRVIEGGCLKGQADEAKDVEDGKCGGGAGGGFACVV